MTVARRRSILLLDANLLVLFVVGTVAREEVEKFKRTRQYSADDADLLVTVVAGFENLATTPNVLTEVSNLLGNLREHLRARARMFLAETVRQVSERYVESANAVVEKDFLRLGLTDSAMALAADDDTLVLTDDLDLYLKLSSEGIETINFTHLRAGSWGF